MAAGLAFVPLLGDVAKAGVKPLFGKPATAAANVMPNPYSGIDQASQYLQNMGVARRQRVEWLQGFEAGTVRVRTAKANEFGIRYFDARSAAAKGHWLFTIFPASRGSLALKLYWNQMTNFRQWQIRPGATVIEGRAAGQGLGLQGGDLQKFILNVDDLLD